MANAVVLWLLLLVPLLLQVPLAVYLFRTVKVEENPSHDDVWSEERRRQLAAKRAGVETRPGGRSSASSLVCQYCGSENDPDYEFCEACVGRLR